LWYLYARVATSPGGGQFILNYFNYFTEIEEAFVRRRKRHLLLSPTDWALIESWKTLGVPLHIALRGIERSFDSYESAPRRRAVKTLFYCQEEVEAQFGEWLERQQGASPEDAETTSDDSDTLPRAPILEHLQHAAEGLRECAAQRRPDDFGETLNRAAAALDELAQDYAQAAQPNPERLEQSLNTWENRLDEALLQAAPPPELADAQTQADAQLKGYRKQMDAEVYAQTAQNLILKQLRQLYGVPRLSLFYL
jgi:hypothetical protein